MGMKTEPCPVPECDLPVDVVIKSSDDKFFGTHAVNLAVFSHAFPPASLASSYPASTDDPVCLTETGDVVELLLRCMHNQRQPDLLSPRSKVLIALAEAVEKYLVYPAMEICRLHMNRLADIYPKEVFAYAVKHGYPELLDQTAPLTLTWDAKEACEELSPTNFAVWVLYREGWLRVQRELRSLKLPAIEHKGGRMECDHWDRFHAQLLNLGLQGLTKWHARFSDLLGDVRCGWCYQRALTLRPMLEALITEYVKPASELERSVRSGDVTQCVE
ncbi:hypothetical protein AMATHDRAFT_70475 [Amanita thiersii Skay4041]|uniref:BTB domain-containing protein n=1 Tax=Amanita thiersii Skay4041 TaxID=703135 RepID=A0A2A9N8J8_9AGAR|nr:hypothetical protein AMATHDRAFT_70475 [Amanita thiersii Skay4041]